MPTYGTKVKMWKKVENQDTDTEPFLPPVNDPAGRNRNRLSQRQNNRRVYLVHGVLFTVNIILAAVLGLRILPTTSTIELHTFAKDAIRYKKTFFHYSEQSVLSGPPGPETDASWDRLMDDASIRLNSAEISQFNSTSIDLQESHGKLAWLEVYHQIHCVNYIRKAFYRNHYHANLSEQEWQDYIVPHVDHCLNDLVQNAQCRADTTPKFFEWEKERVKPTITSNYHIARTCVDLDYLKDSLKDRVVSHAEMRRLRNPLLNIIE